MCTGVMVMTATMEICVSTMTVAPTYAPMPGFGTIAVAAVPAAPADPAATILDRLLGLLARLTGGQPRSGQTPHELAEDAARRLRAAAATADQAGLPLDAVVVYYRVRFGRHDLGEDGRREMADRLDRLDVLARAATPGPAAVKPAH